MNCGQWQAGVLTGLTDTGWSASGSKENLRADLQGKIQCPRGSSTRWVSQREWEKQLKGPPWQIPGLSHSQESTTVTVKNRPTWGQEGKGNTWKHTVFRDGKGSSKTRKWEDRLRRSIHKYKLYSQNRKQQAKKPNRKNSNSNGFHLKISKITFDFCVHVYVCTQWRSEDNSQEPGLSLHHAGLGKSN